MRFFQDWEESSARSARVYQHSALYIKDYENNGQREIGFITRALHLPAEKLEAQGLWRWPWCLHVRNVSHISDKTNAESPSETDYRAGSWLASTCCCVSTLPRSCAARS